MLFPLPQPPDCHLVFEKNYYSAPYHLRGQILDIWAKEKTIEIFYQSNRVALHARVCCHSGTFVTQKEHYPEAHQAYADTTPSFVRNLASQIGPQTEVLIKNLLSGDTPLRHLRRAQGIIRLGKIYGSDSLEKACEKANNLNQKTYVFIERLLKRGGCFQNTDTNNSIERGYNPFLRGDELLN